MITSGRSEGSETAAGERRRRQLRSRARERREGRLGGRASRAGSRRRGRSGARLAAAPRHAQRADAPPSLGSLPARTDNNKPRARPPRQRPGSGEGRAGAARGAGGGAALRTAPRPGRRGRARPSRCRSEEERWRRGRGEPPRPENGAEESPRVARGGGGGAALREEWRRETEESCEEKKSLEEKGKRGEPVVPPRNKKAKKGEFRGTLSIRREELKDSAERRRRPTRNLSPLCRTARIWCLSACSFLCVHVSHRFLFPQPLRCSSGGQACH